MSVIGKHNINAETPSNILLGAGTYQLPDLVVHQGGADIQYSGAGELSFTYREAVL